jgi:phosphopentomutase
MTASVWRRIVLITLDGVGVGGQPDAAAYGDAEASTLLHVAERCGGLRLPTMERLGLGHIGAVPGVTAVAKPRGAFGRMLERSVGKDTTTGHWEMAGLVQGEPFASFPNGFPEEIIEAFTRQTGLRPLGNIAASGTEIIRQLGAEHLRTGRPIVYTSVDSVFQIAAHEEIIPVQRLYEICAVTRRLLDAYRVGRVIARPLPVPRPAIFSVPRGGVIFPCRRAVPRCWTACGRPA